MSDLSELTIERLVGRAKNLGERMGRYLYGSDIAPSQYTIDSENFLAILAEARRRDALPTRWPTGEQAAEQLARAWHEQYRAGLFGIPAWEGMGILQRSRIVVAASVLARLNEGRDDDAG